MKIGRNFVYVFLFFFLLSSALIFLKPPFLYQVTSFLSKSSYNLVSNNPFFGPTANEKKLKEENLSLSSRIISQDKLISENKALHDQFLVAQPKSFELLPAQIIASPRFLPVVTLPETYILDVGSKDNIKSGNAVVFKNNLVGRISKVTKSLSEVTLVINPHFQFAAKTSSGVLGIVKGQGNGDIFFDNVLLSETLSKEDFVVTSGDLKIDFTGLPSGIVVGKIQSFEKSGSDLFQKAKLESLIDFTKLGTVFVIVGVK